MLKTELPVSEKEKVVSEVMNGQLSADLPRMIIIVVTTIGSALLFLNIVLVTCFVRRRRKKRLEEGKLPCLNDTLNCRFSFKSH
jgi:hypothetical protein